MRKTAIVRCVVFSILVSQMLVSCATPQEVKNKTADVLTRIEKSVFVYAVIEEKNKNDATINEPRRFK